MALSAERNTPEKQYDVQGYPMAANVKIYKGSLAMLSGGYATPGAAATGKLALGMAKETVDNTGGSAGDLNVAVKAGVHRWGNSAGADLIEQDDVGKICYIVDDQTVALTSATSTRSIAGTIVGVDSSGVYVRVGLAPAVDGTALTAEIASREAITTDLASTANAKGASLIGIEDASALITATTVEGALAEKLDGRRVANVTTAQVLGGVPVVHVVDVADGATGDVDVTLTHKTEVTRVDVIKMVAAGGASDTITVKNGANAITDAIDINVADRAVKSAATIDDAYNAIAAAGTLRITRTKASAANVACRVVVHGVRRA